MNRYKRYRIGKTYISNTNPEHAMARIEEAVSKGEKGYICVSNMRMVRFANNDAAYRKVMEESMMNVPDGTPLVWMGKLWGLKDVKCTNGPSLFDDMLKKKNGFKHFLLGDTEETLKTLVEKYPQEYGTNIVGTFSPPFVDVEDFEYPAIAQMIKDSGADIVWVAMRAPKQDQFSNMIMSYLNKGVLIGVGRAFRFSTGEFKLPEGAIQKLGLSGFIVGRSKLPQRIIWYFTTTCSLLRYSLQILFWRLIGRKPDMA